MIQRKIGLFPGIVFIALSLGLVGCSGGGGSSDDGIISLTGTMSAPSNTEVDSDVNEFLAPFTANDSFATAQSIPNPVTIGGYLNQRDNFTGVMPGRSEALGDFRDIYRVTLGEDQIVRLTISDDQAVAGPFPFTTVTNDFDLFLYKDICNGGGGDCNATCGNGAVGTDVLASVTAGNAAEEITTTEAGTYYLEVCVASGASNYQLSIGQSLMAAGQNMDFVPGEVIVRFREDSATLGAQAASVGLQPMAGGAGREMLMSLGDASQRLEAFARLGIENSLGPMTSDDPVARTKRDTLAVVEALRQRKDVISADPNYYRHAFLVPQDSAYDFQWHYPLINLPQAWDAETGSNTVTVAVIDTGVLLNHPDLQGKLVAGFDFISNPTIANDGNGIDSNPDDPGDGQGFVPSSFHGTHVAGTIGARTDDTGDPSVAGIGWDVQIMPLRVLGVGGGTSFDILEAVRYASGLPSSQSGDVAPRAQIMNLSLGGGGFSQTEQNVYTAARGKGVIIIAAAGNDSTTAPGYPASYTGVVSVSAVTLTKALAPYSNSGTAIDVAAPGGDTSVDLNGDGFADGVLSTGGSDASGSITFEYIFFQGTSMAAPHVAGVAALMLSVDDTITPSDFDGYLMNGLLTEDLAGNGATVRDNQFGYGMIDAAKAVVAAGSVLPPSVAASPNSINFGTVSSSTLLDVQLFGGATLVSATVASTNEGGNWLSLQPPAGGAQSAGVYQVLVDRSSMAEGVYTGQIDIDSDANDISIPVIMQVSNDPVTGDAGYQFLLLLDAASGNTVAQFDIGPTTGKYDFNFDDVPAGNYQLVSGTDNDFDGLICDAGESCGAYPALDEVATLDVSDDMANLNFLVGFEVTVSGQALSERIGREGFRKLDHKGVGERR